MGATVRIAILAQATRAQREFADTAAAARRSGSQVEESFSRVGDAAQREFQGASQAAQRSAAEIERSIESIPKLKLEADIASAVSKIDELKRKAQTATGNEKVRIDADTALAEANLAKLRKELENVGQEAQQAGGKVGGAFAKAGPAIATAAAAVGVAAGAALLAGVNKTLEQGKTTAKFAAQIGLSGADAQRFGKQAGEIYADGFGESVEQVSQAAKLVFTNIGEGSAEWTRETTERVLTVANVFDQDLGGTTRAVGQLLRTELAGSAEEALDILTAGFQTGGDKAEDLLDTVNEYSTQFRKVGIDGKTAMGLISQGLQAGARDADIVADAIKEFSIRAIDGSKTTVDGFTRLGLSAKQMAADIAAGGPTASAALDQVLDRLRGVKDPVEQAKIAVELFGTQAEDLGAALLAIDPSTAVSALGQVEGAAKRAGDTIAETAGAKVDRFKRSLEQGFVNGLGAAIGKVEEFLAKVPPGVWDGIGTSLDSLGATVKQAASAWGSLTSATTGGMSGQEMLLQTLRGVRAVIDGLVVAVDTLVISYRLTESAVHALVAGYKLLTGDVDGAKEAWARSKQAAVDANNAIVQQAQDVQALKQNWQDGGKAIEKANQDAARAAVVAAKSTGDAHDRAGTTAAAAHRAAASAAGTSQGQIAAAAQSAATRASSAHSTSGTQVSSTWAGVKNSISGTFSNAGSLLYSAGTSLVQGLINGIRAMAGRAVSAAQGVVSDAVSGAKRLLGIASPSRVFLEIGKQTGEGFVLGLEGQASAAQRAAERLIDVPAAVPMQQSRIDVTRPIGGVPAQQGPILLELKSSGSKLDDLLLEVLRKAVRVRGGNVQVAITGRP